MDKMEVNSQDNFSKRCSHRPAYIFEKNLAVLLLLLSGLIFFTLALSAKEKQIDESAPFVRFDLDYANAHKVFGYEPSVDLEEGLNMLIDQRHIKS